MFDDILKQTSARERLTGVCIDGERTYRREDAISAHRDEDNPAVINFSSSVVDAALLDPEAKSMQHLTDQLWEITYGDEKIETAFPKNRAHFTYNSGLLMPSISVVGQLDTDSGEVTNDVQLTRVRATLTSHEDAFLARSGRVSDAVDVARQLSGKRIKIAPEQSRADRIANVSRILEPFIGNFNQALTEFADLHDVPLIHRSFPQEIDTELGKVMLVTYTSEPAHHAHFSAPYAKQSTPCSSLESWFNALSLSSFMNTGTSALTRSQADIVSEWLTDDKVLKVRRIREKMAARKALEQAEKEAGLVTEQAVEEQSLATV